SRNSMHSWSVWTSYYLTPAAIGSVVAFKRSAPKRLLLIHAALVISVCLILAVGPRLNCQVKPLALALFIVGAVAAIYFLRWRGVAYAASSIIQESSMLLAAVVVGPTVLGVILTATIYSLAHLISPPKWRVTLPITLAWGICSIVIYFWLQQPLLNAAIHLLGGVLLIRYGVI